MKRNFCLMGIVLSIVLLVSCNNGIKEYGSVNLDTSAIARHIVQVNADYTSQQEGQSFGDDEDFALTDEEKKQLSQLLMTEVYLDIQVSTTGSVQKTEKQKITYVEMLMSATSTDAHGNSVADDLQLEIKDIPAGSTIDLEASVAMICTDKYKDGVKAIYEAALKRSFGTDDQGNLPEYAQYILDMAIQSLVMGVGGNQKYEGKTDQPITIKAGKNSATIQMYQTDGFIAGGSFDIELEDNKPLELVYGYDEDANTMNFACSNSYYKIIRVEYNEMNSRTIIDLDSTTEDISNSEDVGMNNVYCITLDEDGLLISANNPADRVSSFFYDGVSLLIIAKNQITGSYKTTVFAGL